jgi:hypothetical protein
MDENDILVLNQEITSLREENEILKIKLAKTIKSKKKFTLPYLMFFRKISTVSIRVEK